MRKKIKVKRRHLNYTIQYKLSNNQNNHTTGHNHPNKVQMGPYTKYDLSWLPDHGFKISNDIQYNTTGTNHPNKVYLVAKCKYKSTF